MSQKKIKLRYPNLSLEWKEIYSLPFTDTYDTKIKELQNKLIDNIVCKNDRLLRFIVNDYLLCTFC